MENTQNVRSRDECVHAHRVPDGIHRHPDGLRLARLIGLAERLATFLADIIAHARCQEERPKALVRNEEVAARHDVFLCHNASDKPAVKQIAEALRRRGVRPWLDEWELPPGKPWQPLIEEQITAVPAAAVFIGPSGVGPTQRHEIDTLLCEQRERGCRVIPVLLAGVRDRPKVPPFLKTLTWVDFRNTDPDPLAQLVWGITGERTRRLPG